MKTHDDQTFHGQTLWFLWYDQSGKFHIEVCHFPTIDTEHLIWSKCPRTGARISYGAVGVHFSSFQAAACFVINNLEGRKVRLDTEIEKWSTLLNPSPSIPPGLIPYRCKHVEPHVGLLSMEPYEVVWRKFLDEMGWTHRRHGYCYLYYPPHVREQWVKHDAPTFAEGI